MSENNIHDESGAQRSNHYFKIKTNDKMKRCLVTTENQSDVKSFEQFIKNKFNLDDSTIISLEYSLKDETDNNYYVIDDNTDFQEMLDDFESMEFLYVNREDNQIEQIANNNTLKRAHNSAMAKLAITDIPFKFYGKKSENVNHFKRKIINYMKNNNIDAELLLKLILNGNVIKDEAFAFVQNKFVTISNEECIDTKLKTIWDLLLRKYAKPNGVLHYKAKLRTFKQNKLTLGEYLESFNDVLSELKLEMAIQKESGVEYQGYGEYEIAEMFIKGLTPNLKSKLIDELVTKYSTPNVTMIELESVLKLMITKEYYLLNVANDTESIKNDNKSIFTIQSEIETFIEDKINSLQIKANYQPSKKQRSNHNNVPNRKCRSGSKCYFGLNCHFAHSPEEIEMFRKRNYKNKNNNNHSKGNSNNNYTWNRNRYDSGNKNNVRRQQINSISVSKTTDPFDLNNFTKSEQVQGDINNNNKTEIKKDF